MGDTFDLDAYADSIPASGVSAGDSERARFGAGDAVSRAASGIAVDVADLVDQVPIAWDESRERPFRTWYTERAKRTGVDTDPDHELHKYDYRMAFLHGDEPEIDPADGAYHWPSTWKALDHPRRVVDGVDTATGEQIMARSYTGPRPEKVSNWVALPGVERPPSFSRVPGMVAEEYPGAGATEGMPSGEGVFGKVGGVLSAAGRGVYSTATAPAEIAYATVTPRERLADMAAERAPVQVLEDGVSKPAPELNLERNKRRQVWQGAREFGEQEFPRTLAEQTPGSGFGTVTNIVESTAASASAMLAAQRLGLKGPWATAFTAGGIFGVRAYNDRLDELLGTKWGAQNPGLSQLDAILGGISEWGTETVSDALLLKTFGGVLAPGALKNLKALRAGGNLSKQAFKDWFRRSLSPDTALSLLNSLGAEVGTEELNLFLQRGAVPDVVGSRAVTDRPTMADYGETALVAGGQTLLMGGGGTVIQQRRIAKAKADLANADAAEKDRVAAMGLVVNELADRGYKNEAALLRKDWSARIANELPIEIEQAGVSPTDERARVSSPEDLARKTELYQFSQRVGEEQNYAPPPGAAPASRDPGDLLDFVREWAGRAGVDPATVALSRQQQLSRAELKMRERLAEQGTALYFYEAGGAAPGISGGPGLAFVPRGLPKQQALEKAVHEAIHGLDRGQASGARARETRSLTARTMSTPEYIERAYGLEQDRAAAAGRAVEQARAADTESDEMGVEVAALRAEGFEDAAGWLERRRMDRAAERNAEAERGLEHADLATEFDEVMTQARAELAAKSPVRSWARRLSTQDPSRWERMTDSLRRYAAAAGLPVDLPAPRRGTDEQWAAVAKAVQADLDAAGATTRDGLIRRFMAVVGVAQGRMASTRGGQGSQAGQAGQARPGPRPAPARPAEEVAAEAVADGEQARAELEAARARRAQTVSVARLELEERAAKLKVPGYQDLNDFDLAEAVRAARQAAPPREPQPLKKRGKPFVPSQDRRSEATPAQGMGEGEIAGEQATSEPIPEQDPLRVRDVETVSPEQAARKAAEARDFAAGKSRPIRVGEVVDHIAGDQFRVVEEVDDEMVRVVPAKQRDSKRSVAVPRSSLRRAPGPASAPSAPYSLPSQDSPEVADLRAQEQTLPPGVRRAMVTERRVEAERRDREQRLRARGPNEFGGGEISAAFSLATYRQPSWSKKLREEARRAGYDDATIDNVLQTLEAAAQLFERNPIFLPGRGARGKGSAPIKPNADFVKTLDINRLCRRTQKYYATLHGIEQQVGRLLTPDEMISLAQEMRAKGDISFCTFCYVEAGRRMRRYLEKLFLEAETRDIPEGRLASLRELIPQRNRALRRLGVGKDELQMAVSSAARTREFVEQHGARGQALLDMFEKYALGAKGTLILPNGTYGHQILRWSRAAVEEFNSRAGLRAFSATDIDPTQIMDLNQAFADAMVKGLAAHAYSKDAYAALIYGRTGLKINISIAADGRKGFKADTFNGMDWALAKRLRKEYPDTGTIFVAKNQEQLDWALGQDWIDYIIPHHAANWGFEGQKRYEALDLEELAAGQREEWVDPRAHEESPKKTFGPQLWFTSFLKRAGNDQARAVRDYLAFCDKNGIIPRFDRYRNHSGYIKLLKDYARTDSPQRPIDASKIDRGRMGEYLQQFVDRGGFTGDQQVDQAFVDEFVGKMEQGHVGTVEAISAREAELAAGRPTAREAQTVGKIFPRRGAAQGRYSLPSEPIRLRYAEGSTMALAAALRFVDQPLVNQDTGIAATVSRASLRKMMSGGTVAGSVSPQAHMTAVANLDQLFPIAVRDLSRPDRDGDPNIKAWHHFSVPIPFRGELLRAKILAKELVSPGQGTRLYVVQAVEIETEPASYGMDATSPDQPTAPISTPPTGSENQFSTLLDAVKQGKVFEGFGAPGESQGEPKAPLSLPSLAELRERGLNPARAVANAAKYWPAGGKPAEDTIGVTDMGREYLQRVERAWWGSKRLAAGWMSPLNDARRGLSRADRKYIRTAFLRDYEEGGVDRAWPSEAVAGFARAWRDTNERISDEAGELVPTFAGRDPDTYVPHRLTDVGRAIMTKQAGPEWDALVEAAQVNGIDVHVLMGLRQDALRQSRYGSIDYARVADLPWEVTTEDGRTVRILESDPEVLFSHVRSAARRLSTIREFETDEATEQYHDALAAGLIAEGRLDTEAAAVTKDALQRIWKRLEGQDSIEIKTRWRRALWQSLDSVTAALNLSGAVIGNLVGGPLPQMIRMGGAQTMKDFAAAYTTAIKDGSLAEVRALVDLEGDLLHELATTETLEGKVAKGAGKFLGATGFIAVNRKINQAVAAAMIKRQLQAMVEQAGSGNQAGKLWGKDAAAARRYLVDELKFSDEDVERMILDGVTDEDKARAAGKQLELVNAMNEAPGGRPANIAHPLWRLAFAYSTYARKMFDTSKFVAREARAGNVRPLATMIFAGAPTAALIAAIKNFLKDREEEDKGYLERLLVGMTEIGALGLAGSWRYGIMRMDDPRADLWTDLTKPPHVEVVTSLLEGIGKAGAQGELRPLWKGVTGVASGLDILDKQATRRGFLPSPRVIQDEDTGLEVNATRRQREYAERLVDQVYVRRTTRNGVVREPLDPILSKFRPATTRRLIADLRADGLSDEQILTLIEDARARRAREK